MVARCGSRLLLAGAPRRHRVRSGPPGPPPTASGGLRPASAPSSLSLSSAGTKGEPVTPGDLRPQVSGPDPERLRLFQRLRAAAAEQRDGLGDGAGGGAGGGRLPPGTPIRIALPGGRRLPGRALQTTPFQVATELGYGPRGSQGVPRVPAVSCEDSRAPQGVCNVPVVSP